MELRQKLLLAWIVSIVIATLISIKFGVLIGLGVSVGVLILLLFLYQRKTVGSESETGLMYNCLRCGAQVKSIPCKYCGANMGKAVF